MASPLNVTLTQRMSYFWGCCPGYSQRMDEMMADTLRGSIEQYNTLGVLPEARWTRPQAARDPSFGRIGGKVTA